MPLGAGKSPRSGHDRWLKRRDTLDCARSLHHQNIRCPVDEPLAAHFHYFLLRGAGHERDPADPCADLPQNHTGPARMEPGRAGHSAVIYAHHSTGSYTVPDEHQPGTTDAVDR